MNIIETNLQFGTLTARKSTTGWITGIEGVYFGGTALLIVVGVAIDTMKQAESLVLNRQYQGFMK